MAPCPSCPAGCKLRCSRFDGDTLQIYCVVEERRACEQAASQRATQVSSALHLVKTLSDVRKRQHLEDDFHNEAFHLLSDFTGDTLQQVSSHMHAQRRRNPDIPRRMQVGSVLCHPSINIGLRASTPKPQIERDVAAEAPRPATAAGYHSSTAFGAVAHGHTICSGNVAARSRGFVEGRRAAAVSRKTHWRTQASFSAKQPLTAAAHATQAVAPSEPTSAQPQLERPPARAPAATAATAAPSQLVRVVTKARDSKWLYRCSDYAPNIQEMCAAFLQNVWHTYKRRSAYHKLIASIHAHNAEWRRKTFAVWRDYARLTNRRKKALRLGIRRLRVHAARRVDARRKAQFMVDIMRTVDKIR